MAMFEQLNDQLLVNSLDRSWCEFSKIIKNCGPKNPPPGCNLGSKISPHVGRSPKKIWQQFRPYIKKSMTNLWSKIVLSIIPKRPLICWPVNITCAKTPNLYHTSNRKDDSYFLYFRVTRLPSLVIIWQSFSFEPMPKT